jgi:hypothetical protein
VLLLWWLLWWWWAYAAAAVEAGEARFTASKICVKAP